jgi:hypothetical protein
MPPNRRTSATTQRTVDRREREVAAPRLHDEVPNLLTLNIEIEERRGGELVGMGSYVRRVVVDRAPALFAIPCGDKSCQDGGHDVTREIMNAVRRGATTLTGEHACGGYLGGSAPCATTIHYKIVATYGASTEPT